jgi:cytochrome c oxidase assembly protein subunit 15
MKIKFHPLARTTLVLVYLVVMAGAVVRMTGSGMGCPDWPKCFGYYIPPTKAADLEWQPGRHYRKGQVIIWNETLLVASRDFSTTAVYEPLNWNPYTRHDYATFNAFHTWTEFINRLFGAVAGLATLCLAVVSLREWKSRKYITLLSFLVLFGMIFQAWLGATVVFSVLEPVKITLHMLMALAIIALLIYLIQKSAPVGETVQVDTFSRNLLILAAFLTIVQVVLGTQVREFVDGQQDLLGATAGKDWLKDPPLSFIVHRSFAILVLAAHVALAYRLFNNVKAMRKIYWMLGLLGLEILSGISMSYMGFPLGTQPLHLILATFLFGLQFYLLLEAGNLGQSDKTS